MRRFELKDGASSKFWQIVVEGATFKTTFGKIGSNGQTKIKRFDDEATARAEADKAIAEKTKQGYVEVGGTAAPTQASAPKPVHAPAAKPVRGWQFVRPSGEVAIEGPFDHAHSFRDGVANVRMGGKWGMIDREGRFVVPPQRDMVWPSHKQRAGFNQGNKWGYLDPSGSVAIEPRFDKITSFDVPNVPLALCSIAGQWGVIDLGGHVVVPAEWDGIGVGKDGWIRTVRKGLSGFVDPSGKRVIDVQFRCDNFQEGRALVNVNGKFGFIDHEGKMAIDPIYDNGAGFSEGVAFVMKGDKYGGIDVEGRTIIPFEYVGTVALADGRAFVWPEASHAICIDKTGKRISSTKFGDANSFEHGTAVVATNEGGPFGLIDTDANLILPMEYESIDGVFGTHRRVGKNTQAGTRYGYVDDRGKLVCEPRFFDAQLLPEDLAAVETMIAVTESAKPVIVAQPATKPTPVVASPIVAAGDDTPRVLLTPEQIRDHANLRARPPLADQVIAVAADKAAIRKLLRVEENYKQIGACPYFWLEALGVNAVIPLEVAIEVLRSHASDVPAWQVGDATRNALTDCIATLEVISTFESACARARLFGNVPKAGEHLERSLRALAIVAGQDGPRREYAAMSIGTIEAEHPGAVAAARKSLPTEETDAFDAVTVNRGIGLPEADASEIPKELAPSAGKKKLPELWDAPSFARPLLIGRKKALPMSALDELAAHLDKGGFDLGELKKLCDAQSLRDFAWSVFVSWLDARAPTKQKWAFTMLGDFGDDDVVQKLAPMIAEWPGQSAHARAVLGLSVLGAIGSDAALRAIYKLSQRAKFGGLKGEAQSAIARIAKQRGLTQEELADRLVPDFDLDADGSSTLDFGKRSFRVGFDEGLRPYVSGEDGKRLDDLPKPKQSDDQVRAAEAQAWWKTLKKEVRGIASLQIERLEKAMCAERRWHADAFRMYFVEHPLLRHLARRLVWGAYRDGKLARTFRVAEDASLADVTDAGVTVEGDARVGIVHPLELGKDVIEKWSRVLADYEVLQPFAQLARDVHTMTDEERTSRKLERFANREVRGGAVMGLLSRGWTRGSVEDNGVVYEIHHALGTMTLKPGIYFGGDLETQTLGTITLRTGDIGAVAFSEMVHTLGLASGSSS